MGCGPEWVVHRVSVAPVLFERLKILAAFKGQALSACARDAILAFAADAGVPFPPTSLEIQPPRRPPLGTPCGAAEMPQIWCKPARAPRAPGRVAQARGRGDGAGSLAPRAGAVGRRGGRARPARRAPGLNRAHH